MEESFPFSSANNRGPIPIAIVAPRCSPYWYPDQCLSFSLSLSPYHIYGFFFPFLFSSPCYLLVVVLLLGVFLFFILFSISFFFLLIFFFLLRFYLFKHFFFFLSLLLLPSISFRIISHDSLTGDKRVNDI